MNSFRNPCFEEINKVVSILSCSEMYFKMLKFIARYKFWFLLCISPNPRENSVCSRKFT